MLNKSLALDRTFQALSDPTRRSILAQLTRGPTSVSELARPLAMSLPAVMQHLAVLQGRIEWERNLDRLGEYLQTIK